MGRLLPAKPVWATLLLFTTVGLSLPHRGPAAENQPSAATQEVPPRTEIEQRLKDLDSSCYETRRIAAERLEQWVKMPQMAASLVEHFEPLIVEPELPFEIRWRISIWRNRLPGGKSEPPQSVSSQELERLVQMLDDDSYAVRTGANERLMWMAASDHLAKPIMLMLKRRLADPAISEETYRRVESIRNIAWGIWVKSDAPEWNLPPASQAEIDRWLGELTQAGAGNDRHTAVRRRIARQEMLDALAQDAEVPRLKAAIEARLRGKLDAEAAARLRELLKLTRPALVAERWSDHKQELEQHLVVGEAMQVAGADHPSFFDRADDHWAHCVSGNSLLPGDYPVGVAFPAPHWQQGIPPTVFDLVNLPTPRRQIAYSYFVKTDPAARLRQLSRRTLDRFLSDKKFMALGDSELGMLEQLDAEEVSRFASRYLHLVEKDEVVFEDENQEVSTTRGPLGRQASRLGSICAQLAHNGTREATPGLLEAIEQKKFSSPTPLCPYRLEWLAALAIANRDPWPDADAWLAENLGNKETLIIDHPDSAEIGATAAGILVARHGEQPAAFGLRAALESQLVEIKLPGYRYATADDAQRCQKWWKQRNKH